MNLEKVISTKSYQELNDRFRNCFERIDGANTIDSTEIYKTILKLKLEIRGEINVDFPANIRLTQMGRATKLSIKINPIKIIVMSVIFASLLGSVFYFVYSSIIIAFIFGLVTGFFSFLMMRRAVYKSLEEYSQNLILK